jgi:hypothetical protein
MHYNVSKLFEQGHAKWIRGAQVQRHLVTLHSIPMGYKTNNSLAKGKETAANMDDLEISRFHRSRFGDNVEDVEGRITSDDRYCHVTSPNLLPCPI